MVNMIREKEENKHKILNCKTRTWCKKVMTKEC